MLIVPPSVPVPYDYEVVYENNELCRGEVFYVPGACAPSWACEQLRAPACARAPACSRAPACPHTHLHPRACSGSSHRSWNKTPPVLRVMVRRTQARASATTARSLGLVCTGSCSCELTLPPGVAAGVWWVTAVALARLGVGQQLGQGWGDSLHVRERPRAAKRETHAEAIRKQCD